MRWNYECRVIANLNSTACLYLGIDKSAQFFLFPQNQNLMCNWDLLRITSPFIRLQDPNDKCWIGFLCKFGISNAVCGIVMYMCIMSGILSSALCFQVRYSVRCSILSRMVSSWHWYIGLRYSGSRHLAAVLL